MINNAVANSFLETLTQTTQVILTQRDNYKAIYDAVHDLHRGYTGISGVSATDISDEDIMLPTGKAISPIQAAHCLLEFQRTAVFVRGVYKAIRQLQQDFPNERINVLYAGCGPYATLLTPMVTLFNADEVSFTLMDINPLALEAVKKIYDNLDLSPYIKEYICADACEYKIPAGVTIHLAISETMQLALVKEPQVAVMQNILPQLPAKGRFVPSLITVTAQLFDMNEETKAMSTTGMVPQRIMLGEVYSIGTAGYSAPRPVTFGIPDEVNQHKNLFLTTRIETFDGEVLTDYQCSLTNPKRATSVEGNQGKNITFTYVNGASPGFKFEWQ